MASFWKTLAARHEGGGGEQETKSTGPIDPERENQLFSDYLYWVVGAVALALLVWRLSTVIVVYVRTVTSLNSDTQRYFAQADGRVSWFKRNIQYSPIFRRRHNREIQLSSAINIGTLPTRLQLVFLIGYFATNIAFALVDMRFHSNFHDAASQFRNRTGVLATVNMVPLFLMAGRNNPLINILGMSFDTFNLLHRWFGRIVILEALAHTLAWMVSHAHESGWKTVMPVTIKVPFLLFGFIATCAFVAIGIQAGSPLRHAWYETFKIVHIALAALAIAGLWYHLNLKDLVQLKYLYPVIALWVFDRLARVVRIVYANIGAGGTRTVVEALPGNAVRVTVTMARPWIFRPAQHAYLYFPTISLLQSHPFSVAWSGQNETPDAGRGLALTRQDVKSTQKTSMAFVIRARSGATHSLWKKAASNPDGRMITTCFVEGPYGGTHKLHSYGTVMLFAGGVGITQAVPHVRELVAGYANNTAAARKIILVWTIQSPEHLEWIRPWMTEILSMPKRRDCLRIMLFVSRPRSSKEIHSPSSTVQMFPGRPNIERLLGIEMEDQVGTMGVSVCGPGALSDEVRRGVRQRQYEGSIDFVEEAFSW